MRYIDVFNGDADGICALVQLRLAKPRQSQLVTGIKRDINLLSKIQSEFECDTQITVLDISFEKNADDVARLLAKGAQIDYADHHRRGEIIKHHKLNTDIDLDANTCTSLIVDKQLAGQYRAWAITAAFGDNLTARANELASASGFSDAETAMMKELGVLINYNGYGATTEDLFFHPADLYKILVKHDTPFSFIESDFETFSVLKNGYSNDMALALTAPFIHESQFCAVVELPDEVWARRVSGVFSNEIANQHPNRAHAVITRKNDGSYLVSVRAPLNRKYGADNLVSQFPTGGGRKAAAGINSLPLEMIPRFIEAFEREFSIVA